MRGRVAERTGELAPASFAKPRPSMGQCMTASGTTLAKAGSGRELSSFPGPTAPRRPSTVVSKQRNEREKYAGDRESGQEHMRRSSSGALRSGTGTPIAGVGLRPVHVAAVPPRPPAPTFEEALAVARAPQTLSPSTIVARPATPIPIASSSLPSSSALDSSPVPLSNPSSGPSIAPSKATAPATAFAAGSSVVVLAKEGIDDEGAIAGTAVAPSSAATDAPRAHGPTEAVDVPARPFSAFSSSSLVRDGTRNKLLWFGGVPPLQLRLDPPPSSSSSGFGSAIGASRSPSRSIGLSLSAVGVLPMILSPSTSLRTPTSTFSRGRLSPHAVHPPTLPPTVEVALPGALGGDALTEPIFTGRSDASASTPGQESSTTTTWLAAMSARSNASDS